MAVPTAKEVPKLTPCLDRGELEGDPLSRPEKSEHLSPKGKRTVCPGRQLLLPLVVFPPFFGTPWEEGVSRDGCGGVLGYFRESKGWSRRQSEGYRMGSIFLTPSEHEATGERASESGGSGLLEGVAEYIDR